MVISTLTMAKVYPPTKLFTSQNVLFIIQVTVSDGGLFLCPHEEREWAWRSEGGSRTKQQGETGGERIGAGKIEKSDCRDCH